MTQDGRNNLAKVGVAGSNPVVRSRSEDVAPESRGWNPSMVRQWSISRTANARSRSSMASARDCLAVRAREAVVRDVPRDAAGIIERHRGTLLAIDPATQAICCDISGDAAVVVEDH
jgi:hypothetical protein